MGYWLQISMKLERVHGSNVKPILKQLATSQFQGLRIVEFDVEKVKKAQAKSDILDADDVSKVQSVQVDEDVMELESEEEADSALLEEESYKQVDDKDALLYISITDPEALAREISKIW
uniref:Uncharacterized protein n=1 Tax=Romanomermis culicivorax TaxID=13658 RepID=A0A915K1L9_ROMCU